MLSGMGACDGSGTCWNLRILKTGCLITGKVSGGWCKGSESEQEDTERVVRKVLLAVRAKGNMATSSLLSSLLAGSHTTLLYIAVRERGNWQPPSRQPH